MNEKEVTRKHKKISWWSIVGGFRYCCFFVACNQRVVRVKENIDHTHFIGISESLFILYQIIISFPVSPGCSCGVLSVHKIRTRRCTSLSASLFTYSVFLNCGRYSLFLKAFNDQYYSKSHQKRPPRFGHRHRTDPPPSEKHIET